MTDNPYESPQADLGQHDSGEQGRGPVETGEGEGNAQAKPPVAQLALFQIVLILLILCFFLPVVRMVSFSVMQLVESGSGAGKSEPQPGAERESP